MEGGAEERERGRRTAEEKGIGEDGGGGERGTNCRRQKMSDKPCVMLYRTRKKRYDSCS